MITSTTGLNEDMFFTPSINLTITAEILLKVVLKTHKSYTITFLDREEFKILVSKIYLTALI
jgi:hypothetical protein